MEKFVFGKDSYLLNFTINEEKIYLYDETKKEDNLTDDQDWVLKHSANICEINISGRATTIHSGDRYIGCSESNTLKYVSHNIKTFEYGEILEIIQRNDICEVHSFYK